MVFSDKEDTVWERREGEERVGVGLVQGIDKTWYGVIIDIREGESSVPCD